MDRFKKERPAPTPGNLLSEEKKEIIRQMTEALLPKADTPTTQEQLTDIQLALIEIYEVILDG